MGIKNYKTANNAESEKRHKETYDAAIGEAAKHAEGKILEATDVINKKTDSLEDKQKQNNKKHEDFVNGVYTPAITNFKKRIDTRKDNEIKIVESLHESFPRNSCFTCGRCNGTGNTNMDKTQPKPCTDDAIKCQDCRGTGADLNGETASGEIRPGLGLQKSTGPASNAGGVVPPVVDDRNNATGRAEDVEEENRRRLATAKLTPSERVLRRRRLVNRPKTHLRV